MSEMAKKMKRPVYEKLIEVTCSSLLIMKENKQPVIFDTEEGSPYKIFCKVDSRRVNVIEAARDSEKDMFEHLILQNRIKAGVSNSTSRPRDLTLPPSSHITRDSRARTAPSSVDGTGGGDDPTEEGINIDDPTPPRGKSQLDPQPHSSGSTTNIVIRSPLGKNVPVAVDKMQSLLKYPLSENGESAENVSKIQYVRGQIQCTIPKSAHTPVNVSAANDKTQPLVDSDLPSNPQKADFSCCKCGKAFKSTQMLNFHYAAKHAMAQLPDFDTETKKQNSDREENEMHTCPVCKKEFTAKFFLLQHAHLVHSSKASKRISESRQRSVDDQDDDEPKRKRARSDSDPDWDPSQED